jgi:hypothetical protein
MEGINMDENSGAEKPQEQLGIAELDTETLLPREYTAFQKWEFDKIFYAESSFKSWLDLADSFYRASVVLMDGVAKDELNEDTEGIAAAFLFRHYLELALKNVILAGRFLTKDGENVPHPEVSPAPREHKLNDLWKLVLRDAKPKMPTDDWQRYDTEFVEKCIAEFDRIDPKGMTFRYGSEGAESLHVHFHWLYAIMEHVHQVLEGIRSYLVETHGQNEDYETYLQDMYGADLLG